MKTKLATFSLLGLVFLSDALAADKNKYQTDDFRPNSITSREIKNSSIAGEDIGAEIFSLEDTQINLGSKLSYTRVPLTTIAVGANAVLYTDSNVTFTTQCTIATGTPAGRQLADLYPTGYSAGAAFRGDGSSLSLAADAAITTKKLASVRAGSANAVGFDPESRPVHFIALDGTVYYLEVKAFTNKPGETGKCSFAGYIFKINPEA